MKNEDNISGKALKSILIKNYLNYNENKMDKLLPPMYLYVKTIYHVMDGA